MNKDEPRCWISTTDWLYRSPESTPPAQQPQDGTPVYRSDQHTLDAIRAIVREEVHRALHPESEVQSDTRPVEYITDEFGGFTVRYLDEEITP